jgi:type II secretion system protein I
LKEKSDTEGKSLRGLTSSEKLLRKKRLNPGNQNDNKMMGKKGFTLLETLIGISIFAVVGIVCLQAYLLSATHLKMLEDTKTAMFLAERKIEEIRLESTSKQEEGEGIFPQPFENYEWEMHLSSSTLLDTLTEVILIPYEIKVKWQGNYFVTVGPFIKKEQEE